MAEKIDPITTVINADSQTLVTWSENYSVGIEHIDNQHKELVSLTNELYRACLAKNDTFEAVFKETMSRMVEYVRYHFKAEMELLEKSNFPDLQNHKMQHDQLIFDILEAVREYNEGKKFVPNNFVRTLKDWIFSHIAFYDQAYAPYVRDYLQSRE